MATTTTPKTHFLSGKKIIVSGGGMAGFSFAIALHKQWPSISTAAPPTITIYERDTEDAIGREGYSMALRSDPPGGVQALQKLGVLDAIIDASITGMNNDGAGFCLWDRNWEPIFKVGNKPPPGLPVDAVRIARKNLKGVLLRAAQKTGCKIIWGNGCTEMVDLKDGTMGITLQDGSKDTCDLLIAADGSGSKLRAQLRPDDRLVSRGAVLLSGTANFGEDAPPAPVNRDWGIIPSGTGVSCFSSPVDPHSALWSLSYLSPTPATVAKSPVSPEDAKEILDKARELSAQFPPLLGKLLDHTDPATLMRINLQDKKPFAHPAAPGYPGVIFIGDANHAVSPYAGNGANMALCDGWDLAEKLGAASTLGEGIRAYDALVVPRANRVLKFSHFNIRVAHAGAWGLWCYMLLFRFMKLVFGKYLV